MNIIERTKKDPRIKPILDEIQKKVKLKFSRSSDEAWGSIMESNIATIYYQNCSNPAASMAHELLHIDTQLSGYRRIRIGVSMHFPGDQFNRFMGCMDNELQQHKFYKKFLDMGFSPDEMYCENPIELEQYLKESIQPDKDLIRLIPDFFTLIAPGGSLPDKVKEGFLEKIMLINGGKYQNQLAAIESIVVAWRESNSYDNLPVIRELMLVLQPKPHYTWFGFTKKDRPPTQGFFVDETFELENS